MTYPQGESSHRPCPRNGGGGGGDKEEEEEEGEGNEHGEEEEDADACTRSVDTTSVECV